MEGVAELLTGCRLVDAHMEVEYHLDQYAENHGENGERRAVGIALSKCEADEHDGDDESRAAEN